MLKQKKYMFPCSATSQNTRVFCAQGSVHKNYRHDRMGWRANSKPLSEELFPKECESIIHNFNAIESLELNENCYNGSVTYFDRQSFQVQIEEKQTPFTANKLNNVNNGVFTYQPNDYELITSTENSKSRYSDEQIYLKDKDSCSLILQKISLDYDDEIDKLILEGHTLQCLHSDVFF